MIEQTIIQAELTLTPNQSSIRDIDTELKRIDEELDRYSCHADMVDYSIAIGSGILTGILDSLLVGEIDWFSNNIELSHEQTNRFIQKFAKRKGCDSERLKDAIAFLEDKYKVAQDNVFKGTGTGIVPKNHHLADIAHHPTPIGLFAAIAVQFLRVGTFVNRDGKNCFMPVKSGLKELTKLYVPMLITGVLNWLVAVNMELYEEEHDEKVPDSIRKLLSLAAKTPALIQIAKCADNWFGHLVSDMGGSKNTAGRGMGIPGVFLSLLHELTLLPGMNKTPLPGIINNLYTKQKLDLRHELDLYRKLGKQAMPVLINEVIVRTAYFVRNLCLEMSVKQDLLKVDWKKCVPIDNRTVDRMIAVSSLTFTAVDAGDAAVRAAFESGGNWVLFGGNFVKRINVVGAGRATMAVVKEVSNEQKELHLLHEKRLLMDIRNEEFLAGYRAYIAKLEEMVAGYLAENLTAFINGGDDIERGLTEGDTDRVIRGNLVIQSVLGKKPQFTNRKEFDEFMASDIPLEF